MRRKAAAVQATRRLHDGSKEDERGANSHALQEDACMEQKGQNGIFSSRKEKVAELSKSESHGESRALPFGCIDIQEFLDGRACAIPD